MELKIDDKYVEVGFWSFMKCTFLVQLVLALITYGGLFLLGVLIA